MSDQSTNEQAIAVAVAANNELSALRSLAEDAFVKIDAAIMVLPSALQALGDTDEARQFALAQWAIEDAHRMLKRAWEGEV